MIQTMYIHHENPKQKILSPGEAGWRGMPPLPGVYVQQESGEWLLDKEKTAEAEKEEQKRIDASNRENARLDRLFFALRSRVLTLEEMDEIERLDWRILIRYMPFCCCSYNEEEFRRTFDEALFQQFKMRLAKERSQQEQPA